MNQKPKKLILNKQAKTLLVIFFAQLIFVLIGLPANADGKIDIERLYEVYMSDEISYKLLNSDYNNVKQFISLLEKAKGYNKYIENLFLENGFFDSRLRFFSERLYKVFQLYHQFLEEDRNSVFIKTTFTPKVGFMEMLYLKTLIQKEKSLRFFNLFEDYYYISAVETYKNGYLRYGTYYDYVGGEVRKVREFEYDAEINLDTNIEYEYKENYVLITENKHNFKNNFRLKTIKKQYGKNIQTIQKTIYDGLEIVKELYYPGHNLLREEYYPSQEIKINNDPILIEYYNELDEIDYSIFNKHYINFLLEKNLIDKDSAYFELAKYYYFADSSFSSVNYSNEQQRLQELRLSADYFEKIKSTDETKIYFYLTRIYYLLGEYEKSLEYIDKLITLPGDNFRFYYYKAMVNLKTEKYDDAIQLFYYIYLYCHNVVQSFHEYKTIYRINPDYFNLMAISINNIAYLLKEKGEKFNAVSVMLISKFVSATIIPRARKNNFFNETISKNFNKLSSKGIEELEAIDFDLGYNFLQYKVMPERKILLDYNVPVPLVNLEFDEKGFVKQQKIEIFHQIFDSLKLLENPYTIAIVNYNKKEKTGTDNPSDSIKTDFVKKLLIEKGFTENQIQILNDNSDKKQGSIDLYVYANYPGLFRIFDSMSYILLKYVEK